MEANVVMDSDAAMVRNSAATPASPRTLKTSNRGPKRRCQEEYCGFRGLCKYALGGK